MEWFWQLIDYLQKSLAGSALQNFSMVDWILLLALFWGLVQGSRKGFSEMLGRLLGLFLVSMLTLSFYSGGAAYLSANLPVLPLELTEPFIFLLLGVSLWVSVSWCINVFGKILKVEAQGLLKTLGGMAFGVLWMMLLSSFLVQFLLLFPVESVHKTFKPGSTWTGYAISQFAPDLHKFVVSPFHKPTLKKTLESHKVGG